MRAGSVIVDLAAESGGNVEGVIAGRDVAVPTAAGDGAVTLVGHEGRRRRRWPTDASRLYAKNVANLLALMTTDGQIAPDFADEVVAGACLTRDGSVRHGPTAGLTPLEARKDATDGPITLLTIVVLAVFVGFEVVSKVTSTLHTPLMSGANAIHGIILVGAIIVAGQADDAWIARSSRSSRWCSRPPTWSAASSSPTGCSRCSTAEARPRAPGAAGSDGRDRRMSILLPEWTALLYLIAAVCFILALKGLSSPQDRPPRQPDRRGRCRCSRWSRCSCRRSWRTCRWILAAIAVGSAIAVPVARRVQMTQMPQLVAAVQRRRRRRGGAGRAARARPQRGPVGAPGDRRSRCWSARCRSPARRVTFAKLQELMTTRPVVVPRACAVVMAAGRCWRRSSPAARRRHRRPAVGLACCWCSACGVGVLLVLPVGGADVPIVISLLNAFTGLAVAASGLVLGNVLLLVAGTLVGRQRNDPDQGDGRGDGPRRRRHPVRRVPRRLDGRLDRSRATGRCAPRRAEDVAVLLGYAQQVVIVPGYGLAVAQGQHTVAELASALEARGVEVVFGIHPVAGRMPGHMNVLLAEANVPYEALKEMDEVNPEFKTTDVVLVVGANDVVNPAAKTDARLADLRHADPGGRRRPARWCSSSARCARGSPASRTSCSTTRRPRCCSATRRTRSAKVLGAVKAL